jgi:hypothetical protein
MTRHRIGLAIAIAACALALSGASLKSSSIPFMWIGLIWAIAAFSVAALAPRAMKFPVSIAGAILLAVAFAELFYAYTGRPPIDRVVSPPVSQPDPLLGWRSKPSQVSHATLRVDGATIYDVTYTIDENGRRVAPPVNERDIKGCLLFFADSFVFGDGVNDDQTLPYRVGLKTHGRYRIVNYAVNGYGAEHMLAIIERGELATRYPCEPTHVLYAALPHHVHRAAGKGWSQRGPRYQINPGGALAYVGTTPEAGKPTNDPGMQAPFVRLLVDQRWKSRIYRAWSTKTDTETTTEKEIDLYFAIVREAYGKLRRRWPNAELHVISWDIHGHYANGQARFHRGVASVGATIHLIDDILPGYTKNPLKYGLHEFDLHPNAMALNMVASYLVDRLGLSAPDKGVSNASHDGLRQKSSP